MAARGPKPPDAALRGRDPVPGEQETGEPTARYFIGLRPRPPVRERLHQLACALAARHGARAMDAERMHLTLVFLGQTARRLEPDLVRLLGALPAPGELRLDRLGSFGPQLAWIGPSVTPAWLDALAAQARARLDALGARYDRKGFRPHVTLLRSARLPVTGAPLPAADSIDFGPSELLLVESLPAQGRYRWIGATERG